MNRFYILCDEEDAPTPPSTPAVSDLTNTAIPPIPAESSRQRWKLLNHVKLHQARCHHCVITYREKLWIIGGCLANGKTTNSVEVVDPLAGITIDAPSMVVARNFVHAAVINNQLFAIGGDVMEGNSGHVRRTIERYDIEQESENGITGASGGSYIRNTNGLPVGRWVHVTDLPTQRRGFSCCAHDGKIYIFGGLAVTEGSDESHTSGQDHVNRQDTWDAYDVMTGQWTSQASNRGGSTGSGDKIIDKEAGQTKGIHEHSNNNKTLMAAATGRRSRSSSFAKPSTQSDSTGKGYGNSTSSTNGSGSGSISQIKDKKIGNGDAYQITTQAVSEYTSAVNVPKQRRRSNSQSRQANCVESMMMPPIDTWGQAVTYPGVQITW
eukprot:CAMPEP_0174988696 /NCGR_PEP_ID=MMETSP0004_2-20121128/20279_1 /TAXON_ID=420556 /ORGANISM="Ochromonas sp., Strain CCMP1393" /LENGTH=379 /DNA_ID=CAMNT_0016241961 /DNA_START=545 /DNA_END=1684 /DNA_ORIENTATION=-